MYNQTFWVQHSQSWITSALTSSSKPPAFFSCMINEIFFFHVNLLKVVPSYFSHSNSCCSSVQSKLVESTLRRKRVQNPHTSVQFQVEFIRAQVFEAIASTPIHYFRRSGWALLISKEGENERNSNYSSVVTINKWKQFIYLYISNTKSNGLKNWFQKIKAFFWAKQNYFEKKMKYNHQKGKTAAE